MYLTYDEFQDMGGTLDETTFNDMEYEVECLINLYTYNRLKGETKLPNEVKRCVYALIKLEQARGTVIPTVDSNGNVTNGRGIASQSNDGVSISYVTLSASELLNTTKSEIERTISSHLMGVMNSLGHNLLYKGIYPNE